MIDRSTCLVSNQVCSMKVVILAGGKGTRLAEDTTEIPKPLVRIGPEPILWHIIEHYLSFGDFEFLIAAGYQGHKIKRYFDSRHDTSRVQEEAASSGHRSTDIKVVDTGQETMTAGRVKRLISELQDRFLMTWGDGLSNVDIDQLLEYHRSHGKLATVTAVRPPPRFGRLEIAGDHVTGFQEKPIRGEGWINGAFFVVEPEVLDLIHGDGCSWEHVVMPELVKLGQLRAFCHEGFWQCMDNVFDRNRLRTFWESGQPPWKKQQSNEVPKCA